MVITTVYVTSTTTSLLLVSVIRRQLNHVVPTACILVRLSKRKNKQICKSQKKEVVAFTHDTLYCPCREICLGLECCTHVASCLHYGNNKKTTYNKAAYIVANHKIHVAHCTYYTYYIISNKNTMKPLQLQQMSF